MATLALAGDKHDQKRVLRLMALITTRYNWQRNELTMGQSEIAKLWSVDLRTVKREMAKLRALGWLEETRSAARGRVAMHAICIARIMADTKVVWPLIGPDFMERQQIMPTRETVGNVVPFQTASAVDLPRGEGFWPEVQAMFQAQDAATFGAWIARLTFADQAEGQVVLVAPSRFHATYVKTHLSDRLMRICRQVDPSLRDVRIEY